MICWSQGWRLLSFLASRRLSDRLDYDRLSGSSLFPWRLISKFPLCARSFNAADWFSVHHGGVFDISDCWWLRRRGLWASSKRRCIRLKVSSFLFLPLVGHRHILLFEFSNMRVYCQNIIVRRLSFERIVDDSRIWRKARFWRLGGISWQGDGTLMTDSKRPLR